MSLRARLIMPLISLGKAVVVAVAITIDGREWFSAPIVFLIVHASVAAF